MKDFHVFISYSRDDDPDFVNDKHTKSPIGQILDSFKKAGIKPWIDREGKYIGENYLKEIGKGINNSEVMLFVSSRNSNASYFARLEVCKAADKKMKIYLLLLDDTPLHEDIDLLFSAKDKRWFYPNTSKTLDELAENINKHIADIARKEKEKAEAEEAERRRIEEEQEKKRIEAEEKKRIEKLEKDIESIKKRIIEYVEKQQACMKDLLSKEKDLNKSNVESRDCPVCQSPITDMELDYCDICGWHFATPKELVSSEMQQMYEERLHASQTIWIEKQQRKEEIESLKKEKDTLTTQKDEIERKLTDYKGRYTTYLEENKKQFKAKLVEIKKLENELKEAKSQLTKAQQKIIELSKKKSEKPVENIPSNLKEPIAFLLVTEFDQTNVYCLYEGKNIFGAMRVDVNQADCQMLVVSDNNLNSQHLIINVYKENKRFHYSVSPKNESCILALNSKSNVIKTEESVQINDILFIGDVKIQILDNFNKTL